MVDDAENQLGIKPRANIRPIRDEGEALAEG